LLSCFSSEVDHDSRDNTRRKTMTTKRLMYLAAALSLLVAGTTTAVHAGNTSGHWGEEQVFRIDLGSFELRGDSVYWDDKAFDFTASINDYEDTAVGIEWIKFLGDHLGLAVSASSWEGAATQEYRRYEDQLGGSIRHRTELESTSLTLGLLVHLTQRDRAIVPYVGIGGGVWSWQLTEFGDFIDFSTEDLEVFDDFFLDEGDAVGYYWRVGLEIPVAQNWAVYAENRWQRVDDELGGDFGGLGTLDLSGETISAGVSVSF
jgi:opacity protein-like surface antigen